MCTEEIQDLYIYIIPFTFVLQLKPVKLEAIKSSKDSATGPVSSNPPSGHEPADDINAHPRSPSVLYPMHQVYDVHLLSQSAKGYSHL